MEDVSHESAVPEPDALLRAAETTALAAEPLAASSGATPTVAASTGATTSSSGPGPVAAPAAVGALPTGELISVLGAYLQTNSSCLERLQHLERRVDTLVHEQAQHLAQLTSSEGRHTDENAGIKERLAQHETKMADILNQQEEGQKRLTSSLEERLAAAVDQQVAASKALEESLTLQSQALEKSVEELGVRLAETITRTLPQWRTDILAEVQKVNGDLAGHRDQGAEAAKELNDRLAQRNSELDAKFEAVDRSLEFCCALEPRLASAEAINSALKQAAARSENRTADQIAELAASLQSQGNRLEQFAKDEVRAGDDIVRADLLTRVFNLQDAVKEADFERLSSTEGLRRDLETLRSELKASHEETAKKTESGQAALQNSILSKLEDAISKRALTAELNQVATSLSIVEEKHSNLSASFTASEERNGSSFSKLQEQMQEQGEKMQAHVTENAESTLALVRGSEGARISALEETLRKAGEDHRELSINVRDDLEALRKDMTSARTSADERLEASVNAMAARIDPVQQSVTGLVQECQDLCRSQEKHDNSITHLDKAMRAMEARAGPIDDTQRRLLELEWYLASGSQSCASTRSQCLSCSMPDPPKPGGNGSARERSASPNSGSVRSYKVLHGVASRGGPPSAVGWGWTQSRAAAFSPQPPTTPRPASAGGNAAGHALSAARVSRGTKTPASPNQSSAKIAGQQHFHAMGLQAEGKSVQQ